MPPERVAAPPVPAVALSIVVPIFNEARRLQQNMRELIADLDALPGSPSWELILVDDGSTDASLPAAMRLATEDARVTLCMHDTNYGVNAAMRTGAAAAGGECTLVLNADLGYDANLIAGLYAAFLAGADISLASPFMPGGALDRVPLGRRVLTSNVNALLSFASGGKFRTLTCLIRAYRTSLLTRLLERCSGDAVLAQMVFEAVRAGARVVEVPARLEWRENRGRAPLHEIGRLRRYAFAVASVTLRNLPSPLARPARGA